MMRLFVSFILFAFLGFVLFHDGFWAVSMGITMVLVTQILFTSTKIFVFREWTLLLYSLNYLLSPAITYFTESDKIAYSMKIASDQYFSLALPGFCLFAIGLYMLPTKIFIPDFGNIAKITSLNERFLVSITILGIICNLISGLINADLGFFVYLLSLLRFVGAFALFAGNYRKYISFVFVIIALELYFGFKNAMFHDAIMWFIFFGLFYLYIVKPNLNIRIIGAMALLFFVLLIQAFKADYRERVWVGGEMANFETISSVTLENANSNDLIGADNLFSSLNRGNQAWIFASTVDNMDRTQDFQGMNVINVYFISALLPRFLAPDKIVSGDKLIFNRFSGHHIGSGTSMGLGVFAEGYVAYGRWGVFCFTFVLGLMFSLTFKLVEGWSKISPFYVLFILPILNYAVRPDCELQTTINHLSKSIVVFGGLVYLTKYRFTINSINLKKL